ncbi:MAG TPA: hypothetical protein PK530_10290 [Anaerolineales bacterium]|nr:hypothetical protein [Anaerolineales bacterium]
MPTSSLQFPQVPPIPSNSYKSPSPLLLFSLPLPLMPPSLRLKIITFTLIRTLVNTMHRMVYPLLPVLARGVHHAPDGVPTPACPRARGRG